LDDGVESADVTCRLLYSKWDWFRLERIVGTEKAAELLDLDRRNPLALIT
jgi:U3 small nucleolar RNA-associated protein 25